MWLVFLCLRACLSMAEAGGEQTEGLDREGLDREFQAAVAQYDSGQYAAAALRLEGILHQVTESFEVHELMGLVYSGQSEDAKANPHFKKAVELEPRNFDATHNLGELYVRSGKVAKAAPYLEQAQRIDPSSYDNGYDLALAYILTTRLADARQLVHDLLEVRNTAELHNLLGEIEEKDGKFVAAANEYEIAAHADPSESNLFDWGSELLLHRTLGPAVEVFQQASERYPKSARLAIGLGMALYARG